MPAPIDDDLPDVDQDGGSATPVDADGQPVDPGPSGAQDLLATSDGDTDAGVQMQPDGSAIIQLGENENEAVDPTEFFANLADGVVPQGTLDVRARELVELVERDQQARKERDQQYAEGIKRTGMGSEAPGGADFEGASRAVHPVLTEGCIDFAAKAMKEIYPPSGPCRTQIIGKQTPEKLDTAERKRQYMNWQLQHQISEYRSQTKKTLTQLPLGGSQYKNWWYDADLGRPCVEFVPADYVVLPAGSQDYYTSQRIALLQDITEEKYLQRVDSGYYIDLDNVASPLMPEETAAAKASQKVEGVRPDPYNQDGLRRVLVINVTFEAFDEDDKTGGEPASYMWHIDETSGRTLALYRNWDPEDERRERLHWMIDYTFIHWRGAQGIGLLHVIGSLSGAVTGGVRSMLDKGLAENSMSGIKLKGGKASGTSEQPAVGEITEIEGPTVGTMDDIRKLYMPYPFPPSTPVLFNLVQWLVEQARGVVQVASEKIADGKNDMPVGSVLALIEQGSSVFSDIHSGLHHSQAQELKILHRLNGWYMKDKETVKELGDLVVQRKDFQGPCDIIPVSDPLIFSETQRYAQMQAVHALMANPLFQPKFKVDRVLDRTLELLHIQNWDDMIKIDPEPEDLDPVSENQCAALAEQPIKAFHFQDHMAHLKVHLHFMTSPMLGANPLLGPKCLPPLMQHCLEHIVYQYVANSVAAAAAGEVMRLPVKSLDDRFAVTMYMVDHVMSNNFMELGAMFQQAMQLTQQYQQQAAQGAMPPDPQAQATLKVGMAEIERKKKDDGERNKIEQGKVASTHVIEMQKLKSVTANDQSREHVRMQLDAFIQSQKDQREKDRLDADQRMEQWRLANAQILEQMRQEHTTHREQFKTLMDGFAQHVTGATPQGSSPSMAAGGRVEVDHQRAALEDLVGALQASHADLSNKLQSGLASLGQLLQHQSTVAGLGAQHSSEVAGAISAMREVADAIHETAGAQSDAVRAAFEKLQKTMAAPRVRTLKKDKAGNKTAIDRQAKEGETE
jgi:hypothetical protein